MGSVAIGVESVSELPFQGPALRGDGQSLPRRFTFNHVKIRSE